jgi:ribonucleotide monophosphatase NagD (HAD superfamily)
MLDNIARTFGLQRQQICMVGDRLDTDILFGKNGGLTTCLVLSGKHIGWGLCLACHLLRQRLPASAVAEGVAVGVKLQLFDELEHSDWLLAGSCRLAGI